MNVDKVCRRSRPSPIGKLNSVWFRPEVPVIGGPLRHRAFLVLQKMATSDDGSYDWNGELSTLKLGGRKP